MEAWLHQPFVYAGLAPFLAGFIVALALYPLRVDGLAAAGGFFVTAWLIGELRFTPSINGKLMLAALAAPALGLLADFAFRSGRFTAYLLGLMFALVAVWVFSAPLWQKPAVQIFIAGGGIALFVAWTVAWTATLHADSVRAGATGLGLGLGAGVTALMAASATAAAAVSYLGIGLGAACGGFLLVQMLFSRRVDAGLVFCLAVGVQGTLVAVGALMLGRFGWIELAVLALVPLAARLPLSARLPVAGQVLLACFYTLACGGAAVALRAMEMR
jgi:hypothetical protein